MPLDPTFSPLELEFFAEDDLISIVPNFSLPTHGRNTLRCIGGAYGPFEPNIPVKVPLWLALALHKRKNCRILQPDWLMPDTLQDALEEEKNTAAVFQRLPFHYLEIAKLLFTNAKDSIGTEFLKVKELVGDLCKVRFSKINAGLQVLQGPMTVKLNNLSASECNVIRAFFQGALDRFYLLSQMDSGEPEANGLEIADSTAPHRPVRVLRRGE